MTDHKFKIIGPAGFQKSVRRVLDELKEKTPTRYEEAITYLPKAEFNPDLRDWNDSELSLSGRSDGHFSLDGTGRTIGQENTYEWFRFVFLHEVGHRVCARRNNDQSEAAADNYANTVIAELKQENSPPPPSVRHRLLPEPVYTPAAPLATQEIKEVRLGTIREHNSPLTVSIESLHAGGYILGLPGTGKSTLLNSICIQLMAQGESVILFDPKGDLVDGILGTMPEVAINNTYLLDLTNDDWPFALNVFSYPDPKNISKKEKASVPNLIYQAFVKRWPEVEHARYFKNILWATIPILLDHPTFSLFHVRDFLEDKEFRLGVLRDISDEESLRYWRRYNSLSPSKQADERKPFEDRMDEFFRDPFVKYILCQKQGLVDFRQAIIQRKHFLIKLPILESAYQYAGKTIGIFLLLQIYAATFSFASIPQSRRPKFTLIIDEFSQFAFGGEEFGDLFNFGRGLGIRQILAHQTREQLKTDESLKPVVGITKGARTVLCLRLNPVDASEMAALFPGITKRPTDIYIDVLDRLENHPKAEIKEFYWQYVTKLQAIQKIRGADWILSNFGFGEVEVRTSEARKVPPLLNDLLYYTQKEGRIHEASFKSFILAYATLNKRVKRVKRVTVETNYQIKQTRLKQDIQEELQRLQNERSQALSLTNARLAECRGQLEAYAQRSQHYTTIQRTYDPDLQQKIEAKKSEIYKHVTDDLRANEQMHVGGGEMSGCTYKEDNLNYLIQDAANEEDWWLIEWNKLYNVEYIRTLLVKGILDIIEGRGAAKYRRCFSSKGPKLEELFRQLDELRANRDLTQNITEVRQEAVMLSKETAQLQEEIKKLEQQKHSPEPRTSSLLTNLQNELAALEAEETEIIDLGDFENLLRSVCALLITQPLSADKADLSATEIETVLQNLPLRQAYVKTDSHIYLMRTDDIPPSLPWAEFRKRKDHIVKQTKDKYCRGRASIETELRRERIVPEPNKDRKKVDKKQQQDMVEDDDIIE